jgi:hypothetical protein
MLSTLVSLVSYQAPLPAVRSRAGAACMQTKEELATALCPAIGYWDPLGLGTADFWGGEFGDTMGFLREAEIKHGRVAMAGIVGYIVQSNGVHWPWPLTPGFEYAAGLTPPEQWDAVPLPGKYQIIIFVGFLEFWRELKAGLDGKHYMKGGAPGVMPDFIGSEIEQLHKLPLNLWDPAGFTKKMSAEKRATSLLAEVNNGRLAMIGIMSIMAAQKVEGSVPALAGLIKPYAGDVMAPFDADFSLGDLFGAAGMQG